MRRFAKRLALFVHVLLALAIAASAWAAAKEAPKVVQLIATGGTIAMKIDPVKKAPVPAITGEDLLATVPGIAKVCEMQVLNISNVPSGYMNPERWVELQKAEIGRASCRERV